MLSTTKVYIDSRYASVSSGSSIEYEIPGGVAMKPSTKVWLSEFTCVASWHTLDETNRNLYLTEGIEHRALELPEGVYDLESFRAMLQTELNGASKPGTMGSYSVSLVVSGSGGGTARVLRISCSAGTFALPDDASVIAQVGGIPYSVQSILSFPSGSLQLSVHTSGFVDLRRIHTLYLHSPSFGAYNSVGPRGERTIIAKIPCPVGYGQLVSYQSSASEHDFIEAGVSGLTTLRLELRDAGGRLLDLHGTQWSATLLFEL
jgi:hypothetical protein